MNDNRFETQIITSWEEADRLQEDWDRLFEKSRGGEVFSRFGWCQAWWQVIGRSMQPRIILVRHDGQLVALAPMAIAIRHSGPFKFKVLQLIGAPHADYLALLMTGPEEALIQHINTQIQCLASEVDYVVLEHLTEQSWGSPDFCSIGDIKGFRCRNSVITLTRSAVLKNLNYDQFFASLPKSIRYDLRRYLKDLTAIGPVSIELIGSDQLSEHFGQFWAFLDHRDTVTGRSLEMDSKIQFEEFFKVLISNPASKEFVHFSVLRVAGKPIAYHFGFADRFKFYYYKPAFDMEWARSSPGKLLISHLLQDSIANGRTEFDFLMGEEDYKRKWTSTERQVSDFRLYKASIFPRFSEIWHEILKPCLKLVRSHRYLKAILNNK